MMQPLLPLLENHILLMLPGHSSWERLTYREKFLSDSKKLYSEASSYYIEVDVRQNRIDAERYKRSKKREETFNDMWMKHPVNVNEVVDRFAPNAKATKRGVKFEFEGDRYIVKADMPSGYLRIYDKESHRYVTLDGTPCDDRDKTHFKILKREEM